MATRKTCDRCKHYTTAAEAHPLMVGSPEYRFRGACALIKDANEHECPENGVVAWDYEGYAAGAYVGPKFGCIHWEAKA